MLQYQNKKNFTNKTGLSLSTSSMIRPNSERQFIYLQLRRRAGRLLVVTHLLRASFDHHGNRQSTNYIQLF